MAHFSFQGLVYVAPSEPHTGLYSGVDGQLQFLVVVVVDETVVTGLWFGDVGMSNIKMSLGSSGAVGRKRLGLVLALLPSCHRLIRDFCSEGRAYLTSSPSEGCVCPGCRKLLALLPVLVRISGFLERNKSRFKEIFSLKLKSDSRYVRDSLLP